MEKTGNTTIAKNTLILYMRSIFMMLIGLFTSRVILDSLGITNFGIYNAVGGVMALSGIFSASLANATSRFITFSIGRGIQDDVNRTFANIKAIYYVLAFVVVFLGETIGLWFLYHYLVIPTDRFVAAIWVFHFSVASCFFSLISVPYNSAIIAHERMSAFAYISILDAVFKLLVAYLLYISPLDKLIVYASLLFGIEIIKRIIYIVYCRKRFEEVTTRPKIDKKQFKEILIFAGWTLNGNIAWMGYTQGLNLLLNIFFGPVVNAARGVALQVQGVITQFITNFQTALNPQLTKNYAANNLERMHQLLHFGTKFSYFLLLFLTLPIFFEAPFILNLWLIDVPDYTVSFLRLILIHSLIETIANPLNISVHATGNIKKFQMIEGCMLLTIVPISYISLKYFQTSPTSVFIILIIVQGLTNIARILIVLPQIKDNIYNYILQVVVPIVLVSIFAPIFPCIFYMFITNPITKFFVVCTVAVLSVIFFTILCGLTIEERSALINKLFILKKKYGKKQL